MNKADTKLKTRGGFKQVCTLGTGVRSRNWCVQQELVCTAGTGVRGTDCIFIYGQFNIQQFYVLSTQCIYVFCVDLRTNSDYFPIQH